MAVPKPAENKPAAAHPPAIAKPAQQAKTRPPVQPKAKAKAKAQALAQAQAQAPAVTRSTTAKTCPGLRFIEGLVANDWARFAWKRIAEERSLKRAGKAAFSHPGTGEFGLGGWGNLLPTLVGALIRLFRGVSSMI